MGRATRKFNKVFYIYDGLNVNQNVTAPNIQVVELNLEVDTIFAYGNFNIRFKFNTDDQAYN